MQVPLEQLFEGAAVDLHLLVWDLVVVCLCWVLDLMCFGWVQQFEIGREFCHIDQLVAMGMARAFNQRLQLLFVCTVFCKSASRA